MNCNNCGYTNTPNTKFCIRCGMALAPAPQPAATPPAGATPPQYTQYPPQTGPPPNQYDQHPPPAGPPPAQYGQYPQYPPQAGPPQYAGAPPARKGRSPCGCCLGTLVIFLVVIVGSGALVFFLIQSGTLTQRQILNTIGMGTGEANVINLTDGDLEVSLTQINEGSEGSPYPDTIKLGTTGIDGFTNISPGRYKLNFTPQGAFAGGECTLKVDSGDFYQFVAVPEGVAISREKEQAGSGDDLNIATSSFCRR